MGEVYQAVDSKLGRSVAIKFLPEAFAHEAERVARFQREARVLASLNHPNIAGIHGLEEMGLRYFLVMELVSGETLAERIKRGSIPVGETVSIARQIADALEAAHEQGVVHRDLKPANIMITTEGRVKVLDFGLAKAWTDDLDGSFSNSPTLSLAATQNGVILGTAAYMSPEQAMGKSADRRSDIFSFGTVVFEMLSRECPFKGESVSEILASVLKDEPDWSKLPARTPAAVRALVRRCLTKDRKQRLQSIGEARIALGNPSIESEAPAVSPSASRTLAWPLVAGAFALALALLAIAHFREPEPVAPPPLRFEVFAPDKTNFDPSLALSPDGHAMAFISRGTDGASQVWIRDMNSLESRPLPGTKGASFIFWAPDNRSLAFTVGSRLSRIDIGGGSLQLICEVPGKRIGQGAWNKDGVILFGVIAGRGANEGLRRVSAAGGSPSLITKTDPAHPGEFHDFPAFLSDGRHFLYQIIGGEDRSGTYSGSIDSTPDQQPPDIVVQKGGGFVYVPPRPNGASLGKLLFMKSGRTLVAQAFDEKRLALTGEEQTVSEQVGSFAAYGLYTASVNGVLAYRGGGDTASQATWFDSRGNNLGTLGEPTLVQWSAISPDANTVAMDRRDGGNDNFDIWTYSLVRGTASRFTFNSAPSNFPLWSPDGGYVAFAQTQKDGSSDIYKKTSNGSGADEVLDKDSRFKIPYDWSRDGQYIIEGVLDPRTKFDIWVLPLSSQGASGERKAFPYLQTEFDEKNARLSPDGRWLAYSSDETGNDEIYVQTFPKHGGKWQVSTNGGTLPVWSHDGKHLFFIDGKGRMTSVDVKNVDAKNPQFEAGVPVSLFDVRLGILGESRFDVSKDGRFLIPIQVSQTESSPITVLVNWESALKN